MSARRLTGLILASLMLHLAIAGADFSCVQHPDRAMAAHQHPGGNHGPMLGALPGDATAPHRPCQPPGQSDCCRTMATCTVNAAFAAETPTPGRSRAHAVIRPASMRAPRSQITSPDPPPPKA